VRIAVTGSGGFIGKNLIFHLKNFGFNVVGFSSKSEFGEALDLLSLKEIKLKLSDFDVLIHSAWSGSERASRENSQIQDLNVRITRNLVESLSSSMIKQVICFGSQAEFSQLDSPWNDGSPSNGGSEYALAKIRSYEILKNSALNLTWMRLFSVYGSGDGREWIIPNTFTSLKNNQEIALGSCNQSWSLTHVEDIAWAVRMTIETKTLGKFNVSDLTAIPLREHLLLLQELMGKRNLITFGESDIPTRGLVRTPGAIEELGWKPKVTTTIGFKRMINEQL
jgi:nucleoside-diphosphate-sugar epimerase